MDCLRIKDEDRRLLKYVSVPSTLAVDRFNAVLLFYSPSSFVLPVFDEVQFEVRRFWCSLLFVWPCGYSLWGCFRALPCSLS